ncbi:hypothetical protein LOAG_16980 [Loa loa]|uniref:Uncharacterized protein n=1 Tax=Loa loa TaxID=7209 RepID=A0A1S0UJT5_LOALO|nr:hypothetical protein LOAG_16980 [Loa loa]EJD75982.1 hypothetical protein LOAG_16980 [Loa loa]
MTRCSPEFIVFLVWLLFLVAYGTLSKSDRKEKSKKFHETEQRQKDGSNVVKLRQHFEDNGGKAAVLNILSEHHNLCVEERKFNHPVLAYVTPWNNGGYDIAKWAARKFTHISPVWFQFNLDVKQRKTCTILGTHDMDKQWLVDIHTNNSEIKFMPRFVLDGSVPGIIEQFLYNEKWQTNCAQLIVNFIKKTRCMGRS